MVWGGRREEGSGWGTHVADSFLYLEKLIKFVKFKNKIKIKKKSYKA